LRFLVDECTGPAVAKWLRVEGHEVFSVYDEARGVDEDWILITNDKDFGEKVYKQRQLHHGIIFLRLDDERANNKIETLRLLLDLYADRLADHFVVVSETQVRFAKI